eukprot:TRINITY_DN7772_c0_g1_i1.p1 TRINITY_DN7772_c0_g1~~TRINITY_DN7772_c0_g1_i1.p1  ORF type:complete len:409 (+),score=29.75 TRINITY_DN7772_c0_g1_i1:151-1377(+)
MGIEPQSSVRSVDVMVNKSQAAGKYTILGIFAIVLAVAIVCLSLWSAGVFTRDSNQDVQDTKSVFPQSNVGDQDVLLDSVLQLVNQSFQEQYDDHSVVNQLIRLIGSNNQSYESDEGGKSDEVSVYDLFPVPVNHQYDMVLLDYNRPISSEEVVTTYNNYYEFGTSKSISSAALKNADYLDWKDWEIEFTGLVAGGPKTLTLGMILSNVTVEERLYRHRCVEAWSIAVPWAGFPFKQLLDLVPPLPDAQYVKMQTKDFDKSNWSDWLKQQKFPYTEAIAMFEAQNDLAFLVVGAYQAPLQPQNGAPLRLALPWKYGFKSVKSINKIEYTYDRPINFWQSSNAREYGFWANVNPNVSHPRWSQASERQFVDDIFQAKRVPTLYFNGYAKFVQEMYQNLPYEDQNMLYMK